MFVVIVISIIIIFIKNPVKGGIPAKENILMKIIILKILPWLKKLVSLSQLIEEKSQHKMIETTMQE